MTRRVVLKNALMLRISWIEEDGKESDETQRLEKGVLAVWLDRKGKCWESKLIHVFLFRALI